MSERDSATVERIIANTINETARGDPDALAARIVAALAEAGLRIVSANGREGAALGPQRAEMRQLYRSPNGDTWFLARDPVTGSAFVRHQANAPSGGQVTDTEIDDFLSGPQSPEHEALLRLVGASILNPRGAKADDGPTGREYRQRVVGCGDERAGRDARSRRLDRGNRAPSAPGSRRGPGQGCDVWAGPAVLLPTNRLRASEILKAPLGGSSGWRS